MIIESKGKDKKSFYEEVLYIASNYYIFKKNPNTRVHSLIKVFLLYVVLLFVLFISCLFIPRLEAISAIALTLGIVYTYLFVEAKYKLREYRKQGNPIVKIDEFGVENSYDNQVISKLSWDAIEYVLVQKYTICFLPKNFASFAIFIDCDQKEKVYEALGKYDKMDLVIDNSKKYSHKK